MTTRRVALLVLVLAASTLLPSLDAAPIVAPPVLEQLVEGHTVFATIESIVLGGGAHAGASAPATVAVAAPPAAQAQEVALRVQRFPGVLWFNDQYLVAPSVRVQQGLGLNDTYRDTFAAAAAVLVRGEDARGIREPCGGAVMAVTAGYPDPRGPYAPLGPIATTYVTSYLVTDPNDHSWVIDKYLLFGAPDLLNEGPFGGGAWTWPVWVVNLGGGPAFVPDDGRSDCAKVSLPPVTCTAMGVVTVVDDPCMGYQEPSRNGYCYGGQPGWDASASCDPSIKPLRRYNALLYFDLEDLTFQAAPRDHSDPIGSIDTTGCQVGTEWACPWDDDHAEGFSHASHPALPPHPTTGPCPRQGTHNPTNHGGSMRPNTGFCDYAHATSYVDLYYVGSERPPIPAVRDWSVMDTQGSAAAFHDFHAAYPGQW